MGLFDNIRWRRYTPPAPEIPVPTPTPVPTPRPAVPADDAPRPRRKGWRPIDPIMEMDSIKYSLLCKYCHTCDFAKRVDDKVRRCTEGPPRLAIGVSYTPVNYKPPLVYKNTVACGRYENYAQGISARTHHEG